MIFKTFKKICIALKSYAFYCHNIIKKQENFSFSRFGNIWTKLRNRLRVEKAKKFAEIQHSLEKNVEKDESGSTY